MPTIDTIWLYPAGTPWDELFKRYLEQKGWQVQMQHDKPPEVGIIIIMPRLTFEHIDEVVEWSVEVFTCIQTAWASLITQLGRIVILEDTFTSQQTIGGLSLIQTLRQESPRIDARYMNVASQAFTEKQLLSTWYQHCFGSGERDRILQSQTESIQLQLIPCPFDTAITTPPKNSVFLIVGGGRGITAACTIALASTCPCTYIILGRTERTPVDSRWQNITELATAIKLLSEDAKNTHTSTTPMTLQKQAKTIIARNELEKNMSALEATGARILYYAVDILDSAAVQQTLTRAQATTGAVTHLIYGAGIIYDKLIADKQKTDFLAVVQTKIIGLQHILNNLASVTLQRIILFSSISSYYGNRGQCDYAMANAMLNHMANTMRAKGSSATAILWPAWESGMVSESLHAFLRQHHIEPLPVATGTQYFVKEIMATESPSALIMHTSPAVAQYYSAVPFVLDPNKDTWIYDHCPFWTVPVIPMMALLEMMCAAVKIWAPTAIITHLSDSVKSWVIADTSIVLIAKLTAYHANTFEVTLLNEKNEAVANATITVAEHYTANLEAMPPRDRSTEILLDNPYHNHTLFHGKSFQLTKKMYRGESGGYAELEAKSPTAPPGVFNMPLLDAALHQMLQENICHWMNTTDKTWIWFPAHASNMSFHMKPPEKGPVHCWMFYQGLMVNSQRFPKFHLKLFVEQQLWLEFDLVAGGFPVFNPDITADQYYNFYAQKHYISAMLLSNRKNNHTTLDKSTVENNNWLPHHLEHVYGLSSSTSLVENIAIKEHFARKRQIHPNTVQIINSNQVAIENEILNFFITQCDNTVSVSDEMPTDTYKNWHAPYDVIENDKLMARLPALSYQTLGAASFYHTHGVKLPLVIGAMANGISGVDLVTAAAEAGVLCFLGTAGLALDVVEKHLHTIKQKISPADPFGANMIHHITDSSYGDKIVDLYLQYGVTKADASAFMDLTPALVRYALSGLRLQSNGEILRSNTLFAKLSRPELAQKFLSPAPYEMLCTLRDAGHISSQIFECAQKIPIATDITVEADSGGHTDNRPLVDLLPTIIRLAQKIAPTYGIPSEVRIGAAGGIATPESVLAAFALGADYVLTGSINQASVEAAQSIEVKRMLARADIVDVTMAPAADMFEQGIKVQVLKRDTLFAMRAQELYRLYMAYECLEDIPTTVREKIEVKIFQQSLVSVWESCETFFAKMAPAEIERAQKSPKYKMALVFRWYLGLSSKWAIQGTQNRIADFQIWCGPAMGAFNNWVQGSPLEPIENRSAVRIAYELIEGALTLKRLHQAKSAGIALSHADFNIRPTAGRKS